MLLKQSKIILKILISSETANNRLGIEETIIPLLTKYKKYTWNYENVSELITQLIEENYITAEIFFHGNYALADYRFITLTYKGRHYKEIEKQNLIEVILKSVFIPVIVSLLTSAVTTFIGYIWGNTTLHNQQKNIENPTEEIIETTVDTNNG